MATIWSYPLLSFLFNIQKSPKEWTSYLSYAFMCMSWVLQIKNIYLFECDMYVMNLFSNRIAEKKTLHMSQVIIWRFLTCLFGCYSRHNGGFSLS